MKIIDTKLKDVFIIEPRVFGDSRGFFYESFSNQVFESHKLHFNFIQDNHAKSANVGVLRGLHYQKPPFAQTKLVRVTKGAVYDVVVDLRKSSPTFKQWIGVELSEDNFKQLLVPKGFAHGYVVLRPDTEFLYKVDEYYNPSSEGGVLWNDPELNIDWKVKDIILSDKDKILPGLSASLGIFD